MSFSSRSKVNIVLSFVVLVSVIFSFFIFTKSAFPVAHASAHLSQTSSQSDWPMFGFDAQHTHYNSNEGMINSSNVSNLVLGWTGFTDSIQSSPAVANGVVYAGGNKLY